MAAFVNKKLKAMRNELKTALLHAGIFLTVALVPQRFHLAAFRGLARLHPLLLDVSAATQSLLSFNSGLTTNKAGIARRIALHQIVAYADFYLILFYGNTWFKKNVRVEGSLLPAARHEKGPFFFTPHYGQGVWAMYHFKQQGYPLTRLHAPPAQHSPPGEYLSHKLAHWRTRQLEKLTGITSIPVGGGGTVERMRQRLCDEGMPVLAMPDAPIRHGQRYIPIQLLQRNAGFANGVMDLAARENIPVYMYTMAIDLSSGQRSLKIHGPFREESKEQLAQRLADISTQAIQKDPFAWHLWPWVESYLK